MVIVGSTTVTSTGPTATTTTTADSFYDDYTDSFYADCIVYTAAYLNPPIPEESIYVTLSRLITKGLNL